MRGFIRWPLLVLSASGIVALSVWSPSAARSTLIMSPTELRIAQAEVGLSPEAVVVCGALEGLQGTLTAIQSAGAEYDAVAQARTQVSALSQTHQDVQQALSLDPANESLQTQLATITSQLSQAQAQLESTRADLAEVALEGWTEPQLQKLEGWKASSDRRVPPEFRVTGRSDAQWKAIELALIAERRAARLGQEFAGAQQELLTSVRAEQAVLAAQQALQTNLPAAQQAFIAVEQPADP